jgi:hypothetical protein
MNSHKSPKKFKSPIRTRLSPGKLRTSPSKIRMSPSRVKFPNAKPHKLIQRLRSPKKPKPVVADEKIEIIENLE